MSFVILESRPKNNQIELKNSLLVLSSVSLTNIASCPCTERAMHENPKNVFNRFCYFDA